MDFDLGSKQLLLIIFNNNAGCVFIFTAITILYKTELKLPCLVENLSSGQETLILQVKTPGDRPP